MVKIKADYDLIFGSTLDKSVCKKDSIDVTITSPPYNIGIDYTGGYDDTMEYEKYLEFSKKWLTNVYDWTRTTGRLCLNIGIDKAKQGKKPLSMDVFQVAKDIGWKYKSTIIWNSGNIPNRTAWGSWKSASAPNIITPVEVILVLYKDEWKRDHDGTSTITNQEFIDWSIGMWVFNGAKKNGHPVPFPLILPNRCIKMFSYAEDVILDPFAGSGTTIVSALKNGRKSVGIELSEEYYNLAQKYIEKEHSQTTLL